MNKGLEIATALHIGTFPTDYLSNISVGGVKEWYSWKNLMMKKLKKL